MRALWNWLGRLERRRFEAAERAADEFQLPPAPPHTPEQERMLAELNARLAKIEVPDGLSEVEAQSFLRQRLLADEQWMELHFRYIESLYMEGGEECPEPSSAGSGPCSGEASPSDSAPA
jgi:hypothetical protein